MRAQAAGGRPVGLQAGDGIDPAVLRGVARALAAALGGAGRVEARRPYGMQAGDVARVTLIASDRDQITFRRDMTGAIVMVVEVSGTAVPDLAGLLPPARGAVYTQGRPSLLGVSAVYTIYIPLFVVHVLRSLLFIHFYMAKTGVNNSLSF